MSGLVSRGASAGGRPDSALLPCRDETTSGAAMFSGLRQARGQALLLVAAALMLRAMLPAGWMPVGEADGIRVALCTGAGPAFVTLTRDGKVHKEAPRQAPRDPCPFGLLSAQAADIPPPVALAAAPIVPGQVAARLPDAARAVIRRTALPPARGPPELA